MPSAESAVPRTPCRPSFLWGFKSGDFAAITYFDASVASYFPGPAPAISRPRYVIPTSEHPPGATASVTALRRGHRVLADLRRKRRALAFYDRGVNFPEQLGA
jgi:hypothetical protein